MQKIKIENIKNILDYEKIRNEYRSQIIKLKKDRRINIGEHITFVFENRETVLFQIQEMIRAERIVNESSKVSIKISHPNYNAEVDLSISLRKLLAKEMIS